MPLKQSRSHKNLPANWQGHTPDYNLFGAQHPSYTFAMQQDFSVTYARNKRVIAGLLSVFEFHHQHKIRIVKLAA